MKHFPLVGTSRLWRHSKQKGFNLIEVLVAMTILTITVLFMFGMFPESDAAISDARNYDMAVKFAQSKLENWAEQGYTIVVAQPATIESGTTTLTSTANGVTQSQSFTYSISHTSQISGGIEQIEALVYWRQKTGAGSFMQGSSSSSQIRLTTWVTP